MQNLLSQALAQRFSLAPQVDETYIQEVLDVDRVNNKEELKEFIEAVQCLICLGIVRDPAMECSTCNRPFCKLCLDSWQRHNRTCPMRCERPQFQKIHRTIKNILTKFRFQCKFESMGCLELPYYDKLSKHEQNCTYEIETCEKCQIQMRIVEKSTHDCITSLKVEVSKLKKHAKSRLLYYTSGGSQDFHIFDEKNLDWESFKISGEFHFPILSQFVVTNSSGLDQEADQRMQQLGRQNENISTRIFGIGGIKDITKVRSEGNKQISERVTEPTKETFEIFINLLSVQPKQNMKIARAMFGVALDPSSTQIFVVGGIDIEKKEISDCEVYDLKQNMWSSLPKLTTPRSSVSLIVINSSFIYSFGGFPLSNSSIELFYQSKWQAIQLKDGDDFIHPFWAGAHLSDKMNGSIYIFGGGLKYNDSQDIYDYNADNRQLSKLKITLPKEDRFFYNSQKIVLGEDKFITMGRHGVYKMDLQRKTCYKLAEDKVNNQEIKEPLLSKQESKSLKDHRQSSQPDYSNIKIINSSSSSWSPYSQKDKNQEQTQPQEFKKKPLNPLEIFAQNDRKKTCFRLLQDFFQEPDIPLKDKIILGPVDKYIKYKSQNETTRSQERVFYKYFFNEDENYDSLDQGRVRNFYDVNSFREIISNSVENYYTINDRTMEYYDYFYTDSSMQQIKPVKIQLFYADEQFTPQNYMEGFIEEDSNFLEISRENQKIFDQQKFSNEQLKRLIVRLDKIELVYHLSSKLLDSRLAKQFPLYQWLIKQEFSFQDRNHMSLRLMITKISATDEYAREYWTQYIWIDIGIILLALSSIFFTWKYIYEVAVLYNELKLKFAKSSYSKAYKEQQKTINKIREKNLRYKNELSMAGSQRGGSVKEDTDENDLSDSDTLGNHQNNPGDMSQKINPQNQDNYFDQSVATKHILDNKSRLQQDFNLEPMVLWEDLTVNDKIKLFSYWTILSIIGSFLQIFGSLSNIMSVYNIFEIDRQGGNVELLIGLGCMMAWLGLVRYMEYSEEYSILGRTLSLSAPNVLKTMISTLPVLMGYTFLGVALFYKSNRFSSATGVLTTLYALMFGDMVYDTFYDLSFTHFFYSKIYLFSFIFFSICVINSLFISVIEDAYVTAKYTSRLDMFLGRQSSQLPVKPLLRDREPEGLNIDDDLKLNQLQKQSKKELKSQKVLEQMMEQSQIQYDQNMSSRQIHKEHQHQYPPGLSQILKRSLTSHHFPYQRQFSQFKNDDESQKEFNKKKLQLNLEFKEAIDRMENVINYTGEIMHMYRTNEISEQQYRQFNLEMDSKIVQMQNMLIQLEEKSKNT
eukprot:403331685